MESGIDLQTILLVLGVVALFGWFFWHTAVSMVRSAKNVSEIVDGTSARQRAELEYEAKHGPRPWWYWAAQKILILFWIVFAGWFIWNFVQGKQILGL